MINPLDVDDLAAALTTLAEDQALRRTRGDSGAVRAEEFTWSKVGARLYQLFRGVAGNGQGVHPGEMALG
jgi:glycosyltransferase involved in cell wall biosynthesis